MTTTTRQEQINEREHALTVLGQKIDRDTVIDTQTAYTRSQTDYVRIFIIGRDHEGRPEIQDITYFVARARERRMTQRGIAYRGGGYSKGLEAADDAWRCVAFAEPLNQANWRELPSV
jgi:hypothetical protein